MSIFRKLAVFAIVVCMSLPNIALAANKYGAIAYSPDTGAVGWSYDYNSRSGAENRALRGCYKHAGDCKIVMWTRNACAALATGRNGSWGTDWHRNRETAKRKAIRQCRKYGRGCKIKRWICT